MNKETTELRFDEQGFTLIELIVVMAIIAVLVLLAMPEIIGYNEMSRVANIKHDVRVVGDKVSTKMAFNGKFLDRWNDTEHAHLMKLIEEKKLMGVKGLVKPVDLSDKTNYYIVDGTFASSDAGSNLAGTFYIDEDGTAFYGSEKPIKNDGSEDFDTDGNGGGTEGGGTEGGGGDGGTDEGGGNTETEGDGQTGADEEGRVWVEATDADFESFTYSGKNLYRYIGTDEYIILPEKIEGNLLRTYTRMFSMESSPTVKGVDNSNGASVTDMSEMFRYSPSKEMLDLRKLDTSNVTDMTSMFQAMATNKLDISTFNTSKVQNMKSMFGNFKPHDGMLDLRHFDTSSVTNMESMFSGAEATKIDVSSFNTSRVTTMKFMYANTTETEPLLGTFDTRNVTTMFGMFLDSKAEKLDIRNFRTPKLQDINWLFYGSKSLKQIDMRGFTSNKITSTNDAFSDLNSIRSITVGSIPLAKYFSGIPKGPGFSTFSVLAP